MHLSSLGGTWASRCGYKLCGRQPRLYRTGQRVVNAGKLGFSQNDTLCTLATDQTDQNNKIPSVIICITSYSCSNVVVSSAAAGWIQHRNQLSFQDESLASVMWVLAQVLPFAVLCAARQIQRRVLSSDSRSCLPVQVAGLRSDCSERATVRRVHFVLESLNCLGVATILLRLA